MGVRVRIVLVVLSLLAIAALAVPLALSLADRRSAALATERDRQLAALADAAAMPDVPLQRLVDRYYEVYGEGVLVLDADRRVLASNGLTGAEPGLSVAADHALVDAAASPWTRILPWDGKRVLAATGVRRDGELVGAVVVSVDGAVAARDIGYAWSWVGLGCLALLVVAGVVGRGLTRWVLRPMDGLERAVAEMTEGVAGLPAAVVGPPELRHFTSAFNTMVQVVQASLDRQRRLVADASHQLRNPLAAVRLRADTLDDYVSDAGRATYGAMTGELDRLENLLQQLLRLARAEQVSSSRRVGLAATTDESTVLDDVIAERAAFWEPVAAGQRQCLRHVVHGSGTAVQLARHDVEQLLDVAVDNALRYAGPGTVITVSTERAEFTADLIVSDDGSGLPEADLARAAERFWRGRDDGDGTGLGLAIAGEIAAGHGGTISVERSPEGGLLVRYRLPTTGAST